MKSNLIIARIVILTVIFLLCIAQAISIDKRMEKPERSEGDDWMTTAANYTAELAYKENCDKSLLFGIVGFMALAMSISGVVEVIKLTDDEEH